MKKNMKRNKAKAKKIKIEKEIPIKITIEITKNKIKWNYNCDISTLFFHFDRVKHLIQLEMDEIDKNLPKNKNKERK